MNAVEALAEFVAAAPRQAEPELVTLSRDAFADTVACMYAGARMPVTQAALRAFSAWGKGDAAVVGRTERLAPPFAALVNGAAAHAHDYDDYDAPANAHPSAVIFPALLAVAGGTPSSGKDLLDAHAVGVEVLQRLGEALNMAHYLRGWHTTLTLGSIAAAAACARLTRLDAAAAANALSLSVSMASGMTNQGGFMAKPLHAGLAAKNGVLASTLGAAGVTASTCVIDGPTSLARTMGDFRPRKLAAATAKLGRPWALLEHGLFTKAYPSCGYTHRLIDAAIELRAGHRFRPEEVERVSSSVPDYYLDLLTYPRPRNGAEAMFSAEYNVAAALVHGTFDLAAVEDRALDDSVVRRLCERSELTTRTPLDAEVLYDPRDPDTVEVTLAGGARLRAQAALPVGAPGKPMSEQARHAKFSQCVRPVLGERAVEGLWTALMEVEQVTRASELLPFPGGSPGSPR